MADATPPTPPHPKAAAKSLSGVFKNQPKWVWIAGIVVLVGVAYMARRRSQAAAASNDGEFVVDNTSGSVGDNSLYPSASQGAYGGYSDPSDVPSDYTGVNDNAGQPETTPVIINIGGQSPQDMGMVTTAPDPAPVSSSVATGGKQAAPGVAAHAPVAATPLQKAISIIHTIQAADPAHPATTAQQEAQAKAAAAPNVNTQDSGSRSGLNYKVVVKSKKVYYYYESRPGKGDWGEGGKVYKRPAS